MMNLKIKNQNPKLNLVFDMDGTIVDFYGYKNWLSLIRSNNVEPYKNALPLGNLKKIIKILNFLRSKGKIKITICTWGSKESSKEFLNRTAEAKKQWLEKYDFPYDNFYCVEYGKNKADFVSESEYNVLFDDNPKVRNDFQKSKSRNISVPHLYIEEFLNMLKGGDL